MPHLIDNTLARLTENDLSVWKTLRIKMLKQYPNYFYDHFEKTESMNQAEFEALLEHNMLFVWKVNEAITSTLSIEFLQNPKYLHKAHAWAFYTRPMHLGHRYGYQLFSAVLKHLQTDFSQITLTCSPDNPALSMYKQLEFETYGIEPHAVHLGNGRYTDKHLMIKFFSKPISAS